MPTLNTHQQQLSKIEDLGIVPYGSHLQAYLKPSAVQRVRLFSMFGFRSIITPQHFKQGSNNRATALTLALLGYAVDNGAFICWKKQTQFDQNAFTNLVKRIGAGADWVAVPDVVMDAQATLKQAHKWISTLRGINKDLNLLFVYQDNMTERDLIPILKDGVGVFIGGSDQGKLEALKWVPDLCSEFGQYCHVGRVNTQNRIIKCLRAGVDSFDGSGFSLFPTQFRLVQNIIRQNKQVALFDSPTKPNLGRLIKNRQSALNCLNVSESDLVEYCAAAQNVCVDGVGLRKEATSLQGYQFLARQAVLA